MPKEIKIPLSIRCFCGWEVRMSTLPPPEVAVTAMEVHIKRQHPKEVVCVCGWRQEWTSKETGYRQLLDHLFGHADLGEESNNAL